MVLALLGFSVDVVCYSRSEKCRLKVKFAQGMQTLLMHIHMHLHRYLCDRDHKDFATLFELLEVKKYILYKDFNELSSKIMKDGIHLPQVRRTFERSHTIIVVYFLLKPPLEAPNMFRYLLLKSKNTKTDYVSIRFLRGGPKKRQADEADEDQSSDEPEPGAEFPDHYAVLGLSFGASLNEVKKAYKEVVRKFHPDKTGGDETKTAKFFEIQEAYEALSDERVKKAYDAMCKAKEQREDKVKRPGKKKRTTDVAVGGGGAAVCKSGATNQDYTALVHQYQSEFARLCREKGLTKKVWEPPRPSVLLVDEVDVFFGDGFYGKPYQPSVKVDTRDGDGYELLLHIWQERDDYCKGGIRAFEEALVKRREVKNLQKAFPNLSGELLKRFTFVLFYFQGLATKLPN